MAFINCHLDYFNSLFYGLLKYFIHCLLEILNSAVRIVTLTSRSSHITPILKSLHWLAVKYGIDFQLCCITQHALSLGECHYLNSLLVHRLLLILFFQQNVEQLFVPLLKLHHFFGIIYVLTILSVHKYLYFRKNLKTYFFNLAFLT